MIGYVAGSPLQRACMGHAGAIISAFGDTAPEGQISVPRLVVAPSPAEVGARDDEAAG